MGVGMVWFVRPDAVKTAIDAAESAGIRAFAVGEVTEGTGKSVVAG
jgi:phosphoribosylaminoimidazole (AIR) synthetase